MVFNFELWQLDIDVDLTRKLYREADDSKKESNDLLDKITYLCL